MAKPNYSVTDARNVFRLGELADMWGGVKEEYAHPTPHVRVPNPPQDKSGSFFGFGRKEESRDATLSAVTSAAAASIFTRENAPNGYQILQILKEAADTGLLPVLGKLPIDKMTRVRREDAEAFAIRMADEVGSLSDDALRKEQNHLEAEFTLRGQEPPYDDAAEAIQRVTLGASSVIEQIRDTDPERFAEIENDLTEEIKILKGEASGRAKN